MLRRRVVATPAKHFQSPPSRLSLKALRPMSTFHPEMRGQHRVMHHGHSAMVPSLRLQSTAAAQTVLQRQEDDDRRKQSRKFVIVDEQDLHKTDDTFLSEGRPLSSPPKSNGLSHSSPVLASSDGALSRCATAIASPQHRHRAITVHDLEESVCESPLGMSGRCITIFTLQCSSEASEHDSKKSFHEGIAPNAGSGNRSAFASPNRTDISWAVEADPDLLGCQDLRAAISLLQLRIRELER